MGSTASTMGRSLGVPLVGAGGYGCGCDVCSGRRVGIVISSGCRSLRCPPNRQLQCDPIFVLCGRLTGPKLRELLRRFRSSGLKFLRGYRLATAQGQPFCQDATSAGARPQPDGAGGWQRGRTGPEHAALSYAFHSCSLCLICVRVCSCWHPT